MRTPEDSAAATASKLASVMRAISFRGRGLSDRTIQALLDHGIDFPEPLLFMEPSQLKKIPGMGKAGFNEIMRYRENFTTKTTEKNPTGMEVKKEARQHRSKQGHATRT
jgi:hypothetical protein